MVKDLNDNTTIYTDKITYLKNDEVINTLGQSKATKDKITIQAEIFNFNRNSNILIAEQDVKMVDEKK